MGLVDVEVVDAQGNRCPTALNLVKFDLQGPAEWRGGIAQGPDNYILAQELPVEAGINRVILRSTPESGKIVLRASSPGLKSAEVSLEAKPLEVRDGIATELPGSAQSGLLTRGPTPAGDSVRPTRQTVAIVGAKAGANGETVAQAFDDNEETAWKNDDRSGTGWVEFELERPAQVNELVLKMGGWRRKAYSTIRGAFGF